MMTKIAGFGALCALVALCGCSPPPRETLKSCQDVAKQRGAGKGLTQDDLGELTEACMSEKGYSLNRDSEQCQHDLISESANRCYYRSDFWGRLGHKLSHI